ncbi:hypothetical protein RO3G_10211 [Rhizopus delemar RA 99-880]|uniref:Uncharacterized protein n=1 Tax=Rhizopus delemar (strain RA 99-880 / ATCC MYA-4621 / FGSC 9543 / NRRL 43880) TaxID=246409 RepID=I1CAM1_RHIO9|nr:hypothetical protein RO3G_10211 [Rhizopus delemar RA 99-880]|eukprot:EIE85501.1 hypothetical protein RO3G_10211 [Rhizopus delemar RA 99-880]
MTTYAGLPKTCKIQYVVKKKFFCKGGRGYILDEVCNKAVMKEVYIKKKVTEKPTKSKGAAKAADIKHDTVHKWRQVDDTISKNKMHLKQTCQFIQ